MRASMLFLLLISVVFATTYSPQKGKTYVYPIAVAQANADTNYVLNVKQNYYWCVGIENGHYVVKALSATRSVEYTYQTIWDCNAKSFSELADTAKQARVLALGSDSIALVIADHDSVYIYKRSSANVDVGCWARRSYKTTFDSLIYAAMSSDSIVHAYPNSSGWSVSNGSLVKADSVITAVGINLYGRPETDSLGNLYIYGTSSNDTGVFVKYERLTNRVFYFPCGKRGKGRYINEKIVNLHFTALIGDCAIDSVKFATKPIIIVHSTGTALDGTSPDTVFVSTVKNAKLPIFLSLCDDGGSIHSYSYVNPYNYSTNSIRIVQDTLDSRLILYDADSLSDSIYPKVVQLTDTMQVVRLKDTAINSGSSYSKRIVVSNVAKINMQKVKVPTWMTITKDSIPLWDSIVGGVHVTFDTSNYRVFYTLSGTPTVSDTGADVKLIFSDSMFCAKGNTLGYQTPCSLSYHISVIGNVTTIRDQKVAVNFKKTACEREIDLLGRSFSISQNRKIATGLYYQQKQIRKILSRRQKCQFML